MTSHKPGLPGSFQAYTRGIKHIRVLTAQSAQRAPCCAPTVLSPLLCWETITEHRPGRSAATVDKLHPCTRLKLAGVFGEQSYRGSPRDHRFLFVRHYCRLILQSDCNPAISQQMTGICATCPSLPPNSTPLTTSNNTHILLVT